MIDLALVAIISALAAFGLWLIVGWAKISESPRQWLVDVGGVEIFLRTEKRAKHPRIGRVTRVFVEMLECATCFGFWEGLAIGFMLALGSFVYNLAFAFVSGLFISATNTLFVSLARNHLYPENDDDLEDA